MAFEKVAIANRGEIAKRIIVSCHELNLKTVLLYAKGDIQQEAYRMADERVCIGDSEPIHSYLNISALIEGAKFKGAKALHPGYGFLSENSQFAKSCEDNQIAFIGPCSKDISLFGNKMKARKIAQKAGIPVLASEKISSKDKLKEKAEKVTYPLMVKASCGGGGRGLRLVNNLEELENIIPLVRQEALQNFNKEDIFLEKYLNQAKHIEVQVFISAKGEIFILGDRDCSSQRRHQKIIEEAPSLLPLKMKEKMRELCYKFCSLMNYRGAGTLEFLVQGDKFFFLEMNTRIQVEHTVTEMIYGVDLIKAQILTALGQAVFLDRDLKAQGHSIQCRICAEDPHQDFLPSIGPLLSCVWPLGQNIRVDTGFQQGDQISSFYDSLISKIVVWDTTRKGAMQKMKQALNQTIIFGIFTNISFLNFLLSHEDFIKNQIQINSLEKIHKNWQTNSLPLQKELLESVFKELQSSFNRKGLKKRSFNPWSDFLTNKEE